VKARLGAAASIAADNDGDVIGPGDVAVDAGASDAGVGAGIADDVIVSGAGEVCGAGTAGDPGVGIIIAGDVFAGAGEVVATGTDVGASNVGVVTDVGAPIAEKLGTAAMVGAGTDGEEFNCSHTTGFWETKTTMLSRKPTQRRIWFLLST